MRQAKTKVGKSIFFREAIAGAEPGEHAEGVKDLSLGWSEAVSEAEPWVLIWVGDVL